MRHYAICNGIDCSKLTNIKKNDNLILELQPDNKYDEFAIKILSTDSTLIGYVPRYFNRELTELINKNFIYKCTVCEVSKNNDCDVCIKVCLKMKRKEAYA